MNNKNRTKQPNVVPSPMSPIEPQQSSSQKWLPLVLVIGFAVLVGGGILGYQYWWVQLTTIPELVIQEPQKPKEATIKELEPAHEIEFKELEFELGKKKTVYTWRDVAIAIFPQDISRGGFLIGYFEVQHRGKVVFDSRDMRTLGEKEWITNLSTYDYQGSQYIFVFGFSGGANCCSNIHIFQIDGKDGGVQHIETIANLDGGIRRVFVKEKTLYLAVVDDRLMYFYTSRPGSSRFTRYFSIENNKLVPKSNEFAEDYRNEAMAAEQRINEAYRLVQEGTAPIGAFPIRSFIELSPRLLGVTVNYILAGEEKKGWQKFDEYFENFANLSQDYITHVDSVLNPNVLKQEIAERLGIKAPTPIPDQTAEEPSITVLSPKAGEIWKIGDSKKIQWEASPSINRVKIVADTSFYSGIVSVRIITQDVPNDGIFEWIVGTTIGPSPLNELSSSGIGEYRLRIEAHEKPIQSTEIPFSITFGDSVQIPSIEVLPLLENGKWIQGEKKLVLMNAGGQLQPRVTNVELIDERENRVGTMNCKIDSIGKKVVQWDGSSLLNYCGAGTIGKDKEAIPGRYKIGWGDLESDYFLIVAP